MTPASTNGDSHARPSHKAQCVAPAIRRDVYAIPTISRRSSLELLRERQQARIRGEKRKAESGPTSADSGKRTLFRHFDNKAPLAQGIAVMHRGATVPPARVRKLPTAASNSTTQVDKNTHYKESSSIEEGAESVSPNGDDLANSKHKLSTMEEHLETPSKDAAVDLLKPVDTAENIPLFSEMMAKCLVQEEAHPPASSCNLTEGLPPELTTSEAISFMSDFFEAAEGAVAAEEGAAGACHGTETFGPESPATSPFTGLNQLQTTPLSSSAQSKVFIARAGTDGSVKHDIALMSGALPSPSDIRRPSTEGPPDDDFIRCRRVAGSLPSPPSSHSIRFPRTSIYGASNDFAPHLTQSGHQSLGRQTAQGQQTFDFAPKLPSFWDDPDAVKRIPLQEFDPFQEPLLIPQSHRKRRRHGFDADLLGQGRGLAMPRPCCPLANGEPCEPQALSGTTSQVPPLRSATDDNAPPNEPNLSSGAFANTCRYNVRRPGAGRLRKAGNSHTTQPGVPSSRPSDTGISRPHTSHSTPPTVYGKYGSGSRITDSTSSFQIPSAEDFETLARAVISLPNTIQTFQGEWQRQMVELRHDIAMLGSRVEDLEHAEEENGSDRMVDTFKAFAAEINERLEKLERAIEEVGVNGS